ncbi:MAG: DUF6129 family protein, partial [Candidatus Sedimenticola endophacoides]
RPIMRLKSRYIMHLEHYPFQKPPTNFSDEACSDDDIPEMKPIREAEGFNLYLVDGSNHCLCFTPDMQIATGIVVAEIEEDE